jgi:hypothetical protein
MKLRRSLALFFGIAVSYPVSYAPAWRLVQAGYISSEAFATLYGPFLKSDFMFRYADFFQRKN